MVRKSSAILVGLITAVLLVAACSSGSSGNSSGGGNDANVAAADTAVAKLLKTPTNVGVTVPIGKQIPAGKRIVFMSCGTPTCALLGKITQQAGALLRWNVQVVNAGVTPESVHAAWARVASNPPDGVIGIAYPRALFSEPLAMLKAHNVPVVECCAPDAATNGIDYVTSTPPEAVVYGRQYADWIIHDTKGNANVVFVDDKDFPIVASLLQGFKQEYRKLCPKCQYSVLEAATTEVGTTLPSKIVGYLRSHPDVDYVALGFDAMATGVPQALASAGLANKVKFIGQDTDVLNKTYISEGKQAASVAFPDYEGMYRLIDALARLITGTSVAPDNTALPSKLYVKSNLGDPSKNQPLVPDYLNQFKHLWGIG